MGYLLIIISVVFSASAEVDFERLHQTLRREEAKYCRNQQTQQNNPNINSNEPSSDSNNGQANNPDNNNKMNIENTEKKCKKKFNNKKSNNKKCKKNKCKNKKCKNKMCKGENNPRRCKKIKKLKSITEDQWHCDEIKRIIKSNPQRITAGNEPVFCATYVHEVCGEDGRTYQNFCMITYLAKVNLAGFGACP